MRKICGLFGALALVLAAMSCGGSTAPGGGGGGGPPPPPPSCPTDTFCMTISNTFFPTTLTVPAGTTVTWQNDAGTPHNVTWDAASGRNAALAGDGAGNIGDFSTGSHTRSFSTPGTYPFTCTIHPGMKGTLTVQ